MRRALKLVSQGAVTIEQRCHDICKYTYIIYMLQWHFLVENVTQMTSTKSFNLSENQTSALRDHMS